MNLYVLLQQEHALAIFVLALSFVFGAAVLFIMKRAKKKYDSLVHEQERSEINLENIWKQRCHDKELEIKHHQTMVQALQLQKEELQEEIFSWKKQNEMLIQKNAQFEEQSEQTEKEREFIQDAKESLLKDLELAANKLFDAKQEQIVKTGQRSMETVISPFKEQLFEFNKRIEDMVHRETTQRSQLVGQIVELQKQAHQLSTDANNLASALKGDNRTQGNWGEVILERILEQSGLEKGREYEIQQTYENEEGKKFRPDVIVHLPDGKDIVLDSKVSLLGYEQYVSAGDDSERELGLNAHIASVRNHIRGLSTKNYESLEGIRTLDFVFLFIPVEAAYVAAINGKPELFREAYDKSIVLVSPSSLMVAMKTVETIWRHEKQNVNAEKIALSAGRLYDQFVLMLNAFDDIGAGLDKTQEAYEKGRKRLAEGRGNLLNRVEQLKTLGAKTSKKIPEKHQNNGVSDLFLDESHSEE